MEIMNNISDEVMEGSMSINRLFVSSYSPTSFYLEVEGKLCPGFQIGWISYLTVCVKYSNILVGNITVSNMRMVVDDENNVKTEWNAASDGEIQIENMRAFNSFLEDVMPKKNASGQLDSQKRTTAHLSVSPNGHALRMSIDLSHLARIRTTVTRIKLVGATISITVEITNLSSLELLFEEEGTFTLKKGQQIIGELEGTLEIVPGKSKVHFLGQIQGGVSGIATLKGEFYEDSHMSWKRYALRLFEVEINLDEV